MGMERDEVKGIELRRTLNQKDHMLKEVFF
jgi:hypothetical protein